MGEVDHPSKQDKAAYRSITVARVSHEVLWVRWRDEGTLEGSVRILNTPAGRIARSLARVGHHLGISLRGWASEAPSADDASTLVIQSDLEIITFDLVLRPAVPAARLRPAQHVPTDSGLRDYAHIEAVAAKEGRSILRYIKSLQRRQRRRRPGCLCFGAS